MDFPTIWKQIALYTAEPDKIIEVSEPSAISPMKADLSSFACGRPMVVYGNTVDPRPKPCSLAEEAFDAPGGQVEFIAGFEDGSYREMSK